MKRQLFNPDPKHPLSAPMVGAAAALLIIGAIVAANGCSSSEQTVSASSKAATVAASQPAAKADAASAAKLEAGGAAVLARRETIVHRSAMTSWSNPDFGIALEYPWQYGFKNGHKLRAEGESVSTSFVASGGVNLGTIDVPAGYYTGTDFQRAFLSVNVSRKLTAEQCSEFAVSDAAGATAVEPAKLKVGELEYLAIDQVAEKSKLRTYHTFQSGGCYEFVLGLVTRDDDDGNANGDGQVIKPAPVKHVFARLEKVLATVDIAQEAAETAKASAAPTSDQPPQKP